MKVFKIDDAKIYSDLPNFGEDEARLYMNYVNQHGNYNHEEFKISEICAKECDDGKVDVNYTLKSVIKFERIRRITGYLSGDLNTWNNAKRAEESERVKHGMQDYLSDGGSDGNGD